MSKPPMQIITILISLSCIRFFFIFIIDQKTSATTAISRKRYINYIFFFGILHIIILN